MYCITCLAWGGIERLYLFFRPRQSGMSPLVAGVFLFPLMVMNLGVSRIAAGIGLVFLVDPFFFVGQGHGIHPWWEPGGTLK